jgi:hypothetical protein
MEEKATAGRPGTASARKIAELSLERVDVLLVDLDRVLIGA